MEREKVLRLAKLARIEIKDEEAESLSHELDAILGYVGEIKDVASASVNTKQEKGDYALTNVMREDSGAHEPGLFTKKILEQAPAREGDYIKVKKIL